MTLQICKKEYENKRSIFGGFFVIGKSTSVSANIIYSWWRCVSYVLLLRSLGFIMMSSAATDEAVLLRGKG